MALPVNALQNVQTYQMSSLAFLQNSNCFINTSNTKFKNFQNFEGQLGSTVGFDLPPRFTTTNSLVAQFQGSEQRVQQLTVDQQASVSYAFSNQQLVFNVEDYMERFGKGAICELGARIEANVALNCQTGPYRFYGDGVVPINSYNQLAAATAQLREFGAATTECKGYISNLAQPAIVANGLNQFATKRNDEIANSWDIGRFDNCDWNVSNLLPTHTAGTEGVQASVLTVTAVVTDANGGVTSITFSGCNAALDAESVKQFDRFQFNDGVAGQPNMRFKTFVGHQDCGSPVQFQATADATSTGASLVTVPITPPLQAAAGKDQNVNNTIVVGMQASVLPSHRAGMITAGNPLFLAMPQLPNQSPFVTGNAIDDDTGVSIRKTYGTVFAQNQQGFVNDCIWGSTLVPEYAIALIFPL